MSNLTKKLLSGGPSDTIPDAFTVTDVSGCEINTQYSASTTPSGYDAPTTWSVSIGDARTTSNATYASSGTLLPGETLTVRATSSTSYSTAINMTVTISGVTDIWSVTTRAVDVTPNSFILTDVSSVARSTYQYTSVTPSGYDISVSWSISGGDGYVSGGYTTNGTISPGQTLNVRGYSSSASSTTTNVTVTIGGISDTWSITTLYVAPTEVAFTSPGTYNWTVPGGVTSICVVYVNAGGPGYSSGDGYIYSGYGGSLTYDNNIPCTPGAVISLVVGNPSGTVTSSFGASASPVLNYGGTGGNRGGGGAAGYASQGGAGGGGGMPGSNGYAGGGGGGGGNSFSSGGGGGGVGIYGQGTSGVGGAVDMGGSGGSGGTSGANGRSLSGMTSASAHTYSNAGGNYGGGASCIPDGAANTRYAYYGGSGAVRIIWGAGKSFPNNAA